MKNEGVGIAFNDKATIAWSAVGEIWHAVSSRIVSARFKNCGQRTKKTGRIQRNIQHPKRPADIVIDSATYLLTISSPNTFILIISMYAPTEKAPPSIKQKFYEDLQDTLNLVPLLNIHVLLGKFNA